MLLPSFTEPTAGAPATTPLQALPGADSVLAGSVPGGGGVSCAASCDDVDVYGSGGMSAAGRPAVSVL